MRPDPAGGRYVRVIKSHINKTINRVTFRRSFMQTSEMFFYGQKVVYRLFLWCYKTVIPILIHSFDSQLHNFLQSRFYSDYQ